MGKAAVSVCGEPMNRGSENKVESEREAVAIRPGRALKEQRNRNSSSPMLGHIRYKGIGATRLMKRCGHLWNNIY